jgi:hypothetical protein
VAALADRQPLAKAALAARSDVLLDYDAIYRGDSDWRLLPAFDHPDEPARCLVTGTGLTHKISAVRLIAVRVTPTFTSSAPTPSASGKESSWPTAM